MVEAMAVECKNANIFGHTQIGVEFKLIGCLRISDRGAHCDDVMEILGYGKTTVNDILNYLSRTIRRLIMMYMFMFLKKKNWIRLFQIMLRWVSLVVLALWTLRILCGSSSVLRLCGMFVLDVIIVQVVCAHTHRIQFLSRPFYGATNDSTVRCFIILT